MKNNQVRDLFRSEGTAEDFFGASEGLSSIHNICQV